MVGWIGVVGGGGMDKKNERRVKSNKRILIFLRFSAYDNFVRWCEQGGQPPTKNLKFMVTTQPKMRDMLGARWLANESEFFVLVDPPIHLRGDTPNHNKLYARRETFHLNHSPTQENRIRRDGRDKKEENLHYIIKPRSD